MVRLSQARPIVVLAVVLLALCGCGTGGARGPAETITQQQMSDGMKIALEAPKAPRLLEEQELVVALNGQDGRPLDGADVWLAMIMPTMQMSPNEPDGVPIGGGRYRIKAIFTMSGAWNLEVHATVQGQEHVVIFRTQTS